MYKAERANALRAFAQLATDSPNGAYLDEPPALGEGQTAGLTNQAGVDPDGAGPLTSPSRQIYTVSGVPAQVCARINSNLAVAAPTDLTGAVAGPKMACVPSADPLGDDGSFYARV